MRSGSLILTAAVFCLLLAWTHSSAVRADDPPKKGAEAAKADEHGPVKDAAHPKDAEHGAEKKNPFKPPYNPLDLTLWSFIVFLVILGVLWKFAWKPILAGLQSRENTIRESLEQAERTRREAMELQAKLDAQLKDAGGKIAAMMDEARRDAQGVKDQMVAAAQKEIQDRGDKLKREMEMAKDQAMQEIWQQSVTLASLMSSKAVRRSLSPDDHKRLLDESLAELKQAGAGFGKRSLTGSGL
jgi:F-type H+-transporting ATPase subunit b